MLNGVAEAKMVSLKYILPTVHGLLCWSTYFTKTLTLNNNYKMPTTMLQLMHFILYYKLQNANNYVTVNAFHTLLTTVTKAEIVGFELQSAH